MAIFEAKYINIFTDDERVATIEIEDQFYETECEVYMETMRLAYNRKKHLEEVLVTVTFICS